MIHQELGIHANGSGEPLKGFKEVRNRTGYVFYFNRSLVLVQKTELLKDGDKNKGMIQS